MTRIARSPAIPLLLALALMGGLFTANLAWQTVRLETIDIDSSGLSVDEEAYYEYVAPRLDALVTEGARAHELVEVKSRDLLALTRAGTIIETLTEEIRVYGDENSVPTRFAAVHANILDASDSITSTFAAARTALRTFNFSGMSDLVSEFGQAADEFASCQQQLRELGEAQ